MNNESDYKKIYAWLADDKSRYIYKERHLYNNDGNYKHIDNIVSTVDSDDPNAKRVYHKGDERKIIEAVEQYKDKAIYIYGGGGTGQDVKHLLDNSDIKIKGFLDQNYDKINEIEGIPVYNPDAEKCKDSVVIIGMVKYWEVYHKLLSFHPYKIINYGDYSYWNSPVQYFENTIISSKKYSEECFLDVGAYNLANSIQFYDICQKWNKKFKAYAFEPDPKCYSKCLEYVIAHPYMRINLFNCGLSEKKQTIHFIANGNGSGTINEAGTASINVVPLDSLDIENATYIKMDIEGSELEALKGGENTIRKFKPRLAICLYHKPEDIYTIPVYIKKLNPLYKFYIRHYSNFTDETVLYAI